MEMGQSGPLDEAQPLDAEPTEAEPGDPQAKPGANGPGRGSGQLDSCDVSTQRGDSGDWSAVTLNQPVMTGDKVFDRRQCARGIAA